MVAAGDDVLFGISLSDKKVGRSRSLRLQLIRPETTHRLVNKWAWLGAMLLFVLVGLGLGLFYWFFVKVGLFRFWACLAPALTLQQWSVPA